MRRIFKPAVALTAGLALLVLSAAPGAAGAVGLTTAGTITVTLTPVLTVPMAGSTTSHCTTPGLGVNMTSGTGTTTGAGTSTLSLNSEFTYSSGQYLLNGSGGAAITIASGVVTVSSITITGITLKTVTTDSTTSTCTPGTAKCSTIQVSFPTGLTGTLTSGTISGTGFSTSSNVHLAGTGAIAAAGCTPPFSALNGKTVTISSWNIHFA